MNKGYTCCIVALVAIAGLTSCKRKHDCYCKHTGANNTTYYREYRGYSRSEASKLCKSEEYASSSATAISCELR